MKNVVRYPDLRLRKAAPLLTIEEIRAVGDGRVPGDIAYEAVQLLATKGDGAAMAANQAGSELRFFAIDRQKADRDVEGSQLPTVVCNPTIVNASPEMVEELEGCLSFPGLFFKVKRHAWVDVQFSYSSDAYANTMGRQVIQANDMRLTGFWARVFQHETDHLDGKTFVDNLPQKKRMQIANELRIRMQKMGW